VEKKKARRKNRLDKLQIWKVCQLGRFGGFAHRFIASLVFDKPLKRVTPNDTRCISSCLQRNGIKVMDWRSGLTAQAENYAQSHITPKKRQLKLLAA
jgi:hypothetical protein